MQGAMDELLNMDQDQLKQQMEEAMNMLTSMDMQQNILGQQEEVLAMILRLRHRKQVLMHVARVLHRCIEFHGHAGREVLNETKDVFQRLKVR